MTVSGTSLSFSGQITKKVFILGRKKQSKIMFYRENMITGRYFVNYFKGIVNE